MPITTTSGGIFLILSENEAWHFMWIVCYADNSHEMSNLIFSEE